MLLLQPRFDNTDENIVPDGTRLDRLVMGRVVGVLYIMLLRKQCSCNDRPIDLLLKGFVGRAIVSLFGPSRKADDRSVS